jgi:hypothetical protein
LLLIQSALERSGWQRSNSNWHLKNPLFNSFVWNPLRKRYSLSRSIRRAIPSHSCTNPLRQSRQSSKTWYGRLQIHLAPHKS